MRKYSTGDMNGNDELYLRICVLTSRGSSYAVEKEGAGYGIRKQSQMAAVC